MFILLWPHFVLKEPTFLLAGLEFFETSAKENINVKAVFERLVDIICDKMSESLDSDPTIVNNPQTKRLTENPNPQNAGCQC
jgi:Ras-related protein Rab-3C